MPVMKYRDPADGIWKPLFGLGAMPKVKLIATSNQSVNGTGTTAQIIMGATVYDTTGLMADLPNSSIKIPYDAYYVFTQRLCWQSNATGFRAGLLNNETGTPTAWIADFYMTAVNGTVTILTWSTEPIFCTAGQAYRMFQSQNSTVNLNMQAANGAARFSHFAATMVP